MKLLAQILDVAIEDELLDRANPARGRNQRVRAPKPQRTWVEPEQLPSLIDAADTYMRAVVAVLAGAGLRVGEAVALKWRDVNLATGVLRVGRAKTAAGEYREVDLPGGLIEALSDWKARTSCREQDDPAFVSRSRRRQTVTNVDHRLTTGIRAANRKLTEAGIEPISEKVSPHSLRRTYASLRAALRDDPVYITEQGGWTDPAFVFRVYQKAAKRRGRLTGAYLGVFDSACDWALMGTGTRETAPVPTRGPAPVPPVSPIAKP